VQLSWLRDDGSRKSAAFSVKKWNLRRAVWKACVRLAEAREEYGEGVQDVNEMFQTAYPNVKEQYEAGPDGNGNPTAESAEDEDATAAEA